MSNLAASNSDILTLANALITPRENCLPRFRRCY